jgi:hypothetical protein
VLRRDVGGPGRVRETNGEDEDDEA